MENKPIGVVIMTYGSATTAEHVSEYMHHIYGDKVPDGVIEDFENRYRLVGHSPLIEITGHQARLLGEELNKENPGRYIVRSAMLHSDPFIKDAVQECFDAGARTCIGIILSPQFSSFIMKGYVHALTSAAEEAGFATDAITVVGPWPTEPYFVALLSKRVKVALEHLKIKHQSDIPVVFTTHSLPQRVVDQDPQYLDQLKQTIDAVVKELDNPNLDWTAGYQSAGHTPEEWLKPDLTDILGQIRDKHKPAVLIVPIQFLADHLEILYDLDIAGREQCFDYGVEYNRIELPNTDPLFIEALAAIVRESNSSFT